MLVTDIFRLSINEIGTVQITVHCLVLTITLIAGLVYFLYQIYRKRFESHLELDEAEIGIGHNKLKFKANYEDLQIGYMFWVELETRKIGLPIDEAHDVIIEVYNSWYEFFRSSRELIKSIPVSKIRSNESTRQIVRVSIQILNNDLRPHLTMWQAKYRWWWDLERLKPENAGLSPQEIQRNYLEYSALMADIKKVNGHLIAYKNRLKAMIVGNKSF
jgi:hypothetical protein